MLGIPGDVLVGWVLIPLMIFFARIIDVTIGTVKLILLSKGYRRITPFLAFFEVLIWLLVITQIMRHLDNPINYIAYAAGFATGTYVGMIIEEKLAYGEVAVNVVTNRDARILLEYLNSNGYTTTSSRGRGEGKPVHIFFTVVRRKEVPNVTEIIKRYNPSAFYTIQDVKFVSEEPTPMNNKNIGLFTRMLNDIRKSK
ncbi:MAG: DUF2179 domain-containing protein [Candidatus Altiarchaeota archaeon]